TGRGDSSTSLLKLASVVWEMDSDIVNSVRLRSHRGAKAYSRCERGQSMGRSESLRKSAPGMDGGCAAGLSSRARVRAGAPGIAVRPPLFRPSADVMPRF